MHYRFGNSARFLYSQRLIKNSKHIRISVVIPVKNGEATIKNCLEGIRNQSVYPETEIICIDSGSTDGTLKILEQYKEVRVIHINPEEYNHGLTRNLGIEQARGEFVALTVQDARPENHQWLEKMVRHFKDPLVDGVCGIQVVPHDKDKNPHQWFRPRNQPQIITQYFPESGSFEKLDPKEKWKACQWDDVISMYRRQSKLKIPFRKTNYGEDLIWAKEALQKGCKLVYDQKVRVFHYHFPHFDYIYQRTFTVWKMIYDLFEYNRPFPYGPFEYLYILYRNFKYQAKFRWIWINWVNITAIFSGVLKFKISVFLKMSKSTGHFEEDGYNVPQGKES